ncbi:MAG: ATP synthase F1 subunit gamma [Oscillospiraceae bacterium]|jgi:F-type H+-transporting ATPase subunit gamma|nr:ATP synthase F1 subunit gamma [Oscillospiraceae bacterium]
MKAIKRRIVSVSSTQQIMKAMNLVAASKLQKSRVQLNVIRPLYDNIKVVMDGIQSGEDAADSVYFQKREPKNAAYLIITGDRGLCGGYNLNISKEAIAHINSHPAHEKIIIVGAKGRDYFKRRGKNVVKFYPCVADAVTYEDAERIGRRLIKMYISGEVDEVYIAYTQFETILSQTPSVIKVLPLGTEPDAETNHQAMKYEPDVQTFMDYAVPMYLNTVIYGAMAESHVCEEASRMTSMDAATRNAEEIIDDLTLAYNRKRQGAITQEITEIVSGANAIQ